MTPSSRPPEFPHCLCQPLPMGSPGCPRILSHSEAEMAVLGWQLSLVGHVFAVGQGASRGHERRSPVGQL